LVRRRRKTLRHEYDYFGGCPANCGSTEVKLFGYCCTDRVDIVCQKCGAGKVSTYVEEASKMKHTGRAELGFVGSTDVRGSLGLKHE
jgi:hypothetical protein